MGLNNKTRVIAVLCICLTISALFGIAYAAFTKTLNISGSTSVSSTKWQIEFNTLSNPTKSSNDIEVVSAPVLSQNGTKLSNYSVNFWAGGSIYYTFKVENKGNFDAELTSINIPTPTCTKTLDGVNADQTNTCTGLTYTLTYSDGTALALNDTLNAGTYKTLKLTLTVPNTISDNTADVEISNLGIELVYSQV